MVRLRFALWPIWCADMVCPIASSPTTTQILRKGRWPDTHLSKAFGLIWHQLHILSQMVKWKEQMVLFCHASDPDWWSHSREHPEHGLTSSQQYCSACGTRRIGRQDSLLYSWCMGQRQ